MAGPIRIAVLANAAQAKGEIASVENRGKKFGKVMQVAGRVAAAGLLVVGAAAVKSAQAAAADEQAQSKLAQTLRTGAKATAAQIAQTEKFVTAAGKQFGVTDDELRPALAKLAQATGSVAKAQKLASIAMDVSTGSGKSLEAVSAALAKAQATGNVKALAKFGVATKDAHGKTLSLAKVTQELADKYKGAAAKNAETAAGKQKILSVQMGELQEQIGAGLLPVMQKLAAIGLKTVDWISKNTGKAKALGIVIGSLAAAVLIANVAQKVYTASTILFNGIAAVVRGALVAWRTAQLALNFALAANPIGLVVLAIAAFVAGIVIAYKKSETFRNIVNGAFKGISAAAKFMWEHGIRPYFKFIADVWLTVVGVLVNGAAKAFGWVPGIGGKLKKAAEKFNEFKDKVNRALSGVHHDVNVTVHMRLDASKYTAGIKSLPLMPAGTGGRTTTAPRTSTTSPFFSPRTAVQQQPAQPSVVIENVNLQVPVGANGVDIGRELVGHIQTYYAVGGQRL